MPYYVTSVAGETQEITINFSPDHESPFYVDVLHIELNGQVHAFVNIYTLCLVPKPHPAHISLPVLHNTESDLCWGGFGSGTTVTLLFIIGYSYYPALILCSSERPWVV